LNANFLVLQKEEFFYQLKKKNEIFNIIYIAELFPFQYGVTPDFGKTHKIKVTLSTIPLVGGKIKTLSGDRCAGIKSINNSLRQGG
jgi:hypothetical protein